MVQRDKRKINVLYCELYTNENLGYDWMNDTRTWKIYTQQSEQWTVMQRAGKRSEVKLSLRLA